MKVILYGYGKNLKKEYRDLCEIEVLAISDQRVPKEIAGISSEFSCPFISPEEILKFDYDYVAITSVSLFESIKQHLVCENQIPLEKIVSMQLLLKNNFEKDYLKEKVYAENELGCSIELLQYLPSETELLDIKKAGLTQRFALPYYDLYMEEDVLASGTADSSMYVVTHKAYNFPLLFDYKPICVGSYGHDGWLSDSKQEQISRLNNRINELTAVYWVWKNKKTDIVGFCHYRRFFCNDGIACYENPLKMNRAERYLKEVDVIVHQRTFKENRTIIEELKMPLSEEAFETGYGIILKKMQQYQSEYLFDLEMILSGRTLCYYNMFVTTWDIFDAYCEWLFSFLIPAAEEFDVDAYEGQDRRTIGFFAERMLSVWLHHNPLKIKSLPVFTP